MARFRLIDRGVSRPVQCPTVVAFRNTVERHYRFTICTHVARIWINGPDLAIGCLELCEPDAQRLVRRISKAGHTVALAERNLTGGTCVNFGCTPSKSLVRAARAVYQARDGEKFGYKLGTTLRVDFVALMTRVREMRAFSSSFDAVAVAPVTGIDVFLGDARFVGPDAVEVDGRQLRFDKAPIATESGPAVPNLPGLAAAINLQGLSIVE